MTRGCSQGRQALRAVACLAFAALLGVTASGCDAAAESRPGVGTPATASVPPSRPAGTGDPTLEGAGLPTLAPPAVMSRVPTRIRVPKLGIDLAVVQPADASGRFPACDVAEFLPTLSRPGRPGPTFIYAHARPGMFLPILDAALVDRGRDLIGLVVHVFTNDEIRFSYEITEVRRHVESLDFAYRTASEQLILQTSEGPVGTRGKTIAIAVPLGSEPAAPGEARPRAVPVRCD
jgi:hypothetical protein